MRLLVDIGNTEATVGLSEGEIVRGRWRLTSSHERTPDEWAVAIDSFVVRAGHAPAEIRAACMGSVVPAVTQSIIDAIRSVFTTEIAQVTPRSVLPLTLDVDEPMAVGADRIVNSLAALERSPDGCIVVDLGTATTFDCVTSDRRFIGGSIMPGLRTSADQLVRRAAKLTATELTPPSRAIEIGRAHV